MQSPRSIFNRDVIAGLLFVGLGAGAIAIASGYPLGTAMRMGPGYFPILVAAMIVALGLAVTVAGLMRGGGAERFGAIPWRPLFCVLAGVAVFALTIGRFGLIPAVTAMTLIARFSEPMGSKLELAGLVVALNAVAYAIFIYGLNLPLRVGFW
ncbi:MAG: tripartite tricarboxylate transporter TctB family protein [Microvirga sp.]|nr:tripartite tricarboxylate transporter TctB family protein [Microvirga sp.]